ncbi:hypothetical protein [Nonomuraea jabiensis]|uniref:hypothetical protein n=1 Tax=Nonomuraea jabiensis TaxID=882448 RepID=UPI00369C3358
MNACRALHHAIARGRGVTILTMLLDAGADVNLPWDRWDVGRRPLAPAARCGHLAAYELLASRGATADLDDRAFDDAGPTPLDCALWALRDNRAEDGDYLGTVAALLEAGAPTRLGPPTGDPAIDRLLLNRISRA